MSAVRTPSPSMIDVARAAGVSLGTVSNVVNNPQKVSPATREKVETAISELGFVRNGVARSLKAGRSSTIGFVVVDLGNSFFLDLARGAETEVNDAGMNLLLANADMREDKERTYLALFEEERVAGILLAPRPLTAEEAPRPPAVRAPCVLVNDPSAGPDVCRVLTDNDHGGYLAARHLIDLGRRRLLFAGAVALEPVRHRLAGARRAVAETNGAVSLEHLPTDWVRVPDGREVADVLLRRPAPERPDGILAGADLLALGLVQSLAVDGRLRVPEDVAVIGYDNNRAAWDSVIPISTLDQAGEEMGRVAAALLLEEIRAPSGHEHRSVTLEPVLVPRESTVGR
jgi:LacI family transcriptional regulator